MPQVSEFSWILGSFKFLILFLAIILVSNFNSHPYMVTNLAHKSIFSFSILM